MDSSAEYLRPISISTCGHPAAKSIYGNGALVGLLGAVFGSVPMTLVLMITGGQTERPFVPFLIGAMLVGAILGPIGGMIGMAIFQTHLALENSKISRIVAVLGAALVLVGTFLPLTPLPLIGGQSMAFFISEGLWWGLLAPTLAVLSVVMVKAQSSGVVLDSRSHMHPCGPVSAFLVPNVLAGPTALARHRHRKRWIGNGERRNIVTHRFGACLPPDASANDWLSVNL